MLPRDIKLRDILPPDAEVAARHADLAVAGVTADSRTVKRGDLFVAIAGGKADGLRFVAPAISAGAAAILSERAPDGPLPDDVAEYIARAIKSNVRELEGALTRLMAYASLTGATVSLATAQQVLRNIIASQEKRVTIDLIQKRVSEHFNLREQDLKVRSNTRAIAFPRQVAMYIVKQLTTASLPEIGRQFGGKHHTTVLHSINKIEDLRRSDKDLNRTITRLMDALQ